MSNETEKKLEKFITDFDVKFPIIRSSNAMAAFGARGYPTYVFVGADGKLVADPGRPSTDMVEEALKDVHLPPTAPKSAKVSTLAKAIEKSKYADTARQLSALSNAKLNNEETVYVAAAREYFDKRVAMTTERIKTLALGPDYARSTERLKRISKHFKGMPTGAEADAELARFKSDKEVKRELSAMKKLESIKKKYPLSKSSSAKKLLPALDKFQKKYGDTYAGKQALKFRSKVANSGRKR